METIDLEGIPCQLVRRSGRRVRIAFHNGLLRLVLPRHLDPLPIIDRHRGWILEKHEWYRRQLQLAEQLELVERRNDDFLALVRLLSARYSALLKVKPLGIGFRRMKSKWGAAARGARSTSTPGCRSCPTSWWPTSSSTSWPT